MKDGFYSVRLAAGGAAPGDDEAFGGAILVHLKAGRIVGVDQGGCRLTGSYEALPDGGAAIRLAYAFKAGSELANGAVLERATTLDAAFLLGAGAMAGAPQPVDIGLGAMLIRLDWLAEPA